MPTITLRQANVVSSPNATIKGSPLSNSEVDNNFANLNLGISDLSNVVTNLSLSSSEISNGTTNIKITVASGPISVTGNIIPTSDNVFSLGNANFVFADLFLSGNSLHLGNLVLSEVNGNIALNGVEVLSATEGAVPADGSITTAKIADLNVTTAKIADLNVTTAKIADLNVTTDKLSLSGVDAGLYGNATLIPTFIVGVDGRITSASNVSIVGGATLQDNTTADASFFPTLASSNTGAFATAVVSSTKLFFNPSTGTLNATNHNSLSDITLKENLSVIQNPLLLIKNLTGVEFNWSDTKQKSSGLVAQELEKVIPHLVSTNNGLKSVNYSGLVGYLIETIKELNARIEKLERK